MKQRIKTLLFIGTGIGLFYLIYKDYDFESIFDQIAGVKLSWLWVALLASVASHLFRSIRWQLMVKAIGYQTHAGHAFFSVIISYFASLAIPRAGEIARCVYIQKYQKIPVSTSLGTVVSERIVDTLITLIFTAIAVLSSYDFFHQLLGKHLNPAQFTRLLWLGIIGLLALGIFFLLFGKKLRKLPFFEKLKGLYQEFRSGMLTVLRFKNRSLFILLSLGIWACYFMVFYSCTRCFAFTDSLTLSQSFFVFVIATYGVVVPTPAGVGAWHFIVIQSLAVLLPTITQDATASFALFTHSVPNLLLVLLGLVSFILAPQLDSKAK